MNAPRRVMLVGAGGQVARACAAIVPAGMELRAFPRAELDIGDAAQVNACVDSVRPDLLINAAAFTAVDAAEAERDAARRVNAEGPGLLAAALARLPRARMIHLSTNYVFDGHASTPYAPDAATQPLGVYGATKLEGERAVRAALGERAVILRTAWVYSAAGRNFLLTMLRLMQGGMVRVVADQLGTPTASASLAQAIWRIAQADAGGVFHWTDAGTASWYEFAVAIAEEATQRGMFAARPQVISIVSADMASADMATAARRPAYAVLDSSDTVRRFGITQQPWRERLREVMGELQGA